MTSKSETFIAGSLVHSFVTDGQHNLNLIVFCILNKVFHVCFCVEYYKCSGLLYKTVLFNHRLVYSLVFVHWELVDNNSIFMIIFFSKSITFQSIHGTNCTIYTFKHKINNPFITENFDVEVLHFLVWFILWFCVAICNWHLFISMINEHLKQWFSLTTQLFIETIYHIF